MNKILIAITIVLLLLVSPAGRGYSAQAAAEDQLGQPTATPIGTFGGIAYVQYDGIFEGETSTGTYRVPYRITAPANPERGNRTVLVEPPHFVEGLHTLRIALGQDFLLSRGFVHAGVGWSTRTDFGFGIFRNRILDPNVPGVFINGGFEDSDGRTDDEIIVDFARALSTDSNAQWMIGRVTRRYITGFSDTSDPILRLVASGQATGIFDFALPFTASLETDPQEAIADGMYDGKLIIVNSEFEWSATYFVDRDVAPDQYRFYAVAGTPHIPDPLVPSDFSMTSPASFFPELRAHFLQGHEWVKRDSLPPGSNHLKSSDGLTLDRDPNGNAIVINASGQPTPRLPFIELREARFAGEGLIATYDNVKTITDLGFRNHGQYIRAFNAKLANYLSAGYILSEDAEVMRLRASLCPSKTFTEVYRDHYENFVEIEPCG